MHLKEGRGGSQVEKGCFRAQEVVRCVRSPGSEVIVSGTQAGSPQEARGM